VTQDDLLHRSGHECSPSGPSSALCGPPAGRWGSIPGRNTAGSGSCTATARRSWRKPCRNVPLPKVEREEMRLLIPHRDRRPGEAIHAPYRALVLEGAYGGLGIGELVGLRPSRVDLRAGAVTVAETLIDVKGKLIAGPPKTRAGRRTVGLPPFVVRELEEHLAAAERSGSHVYTAAGGGRCGFQAFGRAFGCRRPRQPACRACVSTTFATPPWRCGSPPARRPRRSPCAGHTSVSFTLDRHGHQTIPRPVAEGRCHPVSD
jgi:integrase